MKELSDDEIKSEVDAIMNRIENIIESIDELSPSSPPLSEEKAE